MVAPRIVENVDKSSSILGPASGSTIGAIGAPVRKRAWRADEQEHDPNPTTAPLIVENVDKSIFALDYLGTDKEDDVKRRIQDCSGILPDNQTIRFNGSKLGSKSIYQLGIRPGMRIQLSGVGG